VDFHVQQYAYLGAGLHDDPSEHGTITADVTIAEAPDQLPDIMLVATVTAGAGAANTRAQAWLMEPYAARGYAQARLRYLRVGEYEVEVYRLGDTNAAAPELLQRRTVTLGLPPRAIGETLGGVFEEYQPDAAATVQFELDLGQ
jgi:hypothetical protein